MNRSVKEMEGKERILIVDDDDSSRKSLALVLKKKDYKIDVAGTGKEAKEKIKEKFFNVALLDMRLPDVEGTELLAYMKKRRSEMDVIVVTGYASVENAVLALNKGATAYITKPLNMDELLAKVNELLEKQRLVKEKREAEEKMRESEERLKEAQKIGGFGDWEYDVKTQQITWSDQVYFLLERNHAQGPPTYEENLAYYYPEDSTRLQEQVRRAIEFGEEFDSDYHLNLPSGKSTFHRGIIKAVKDEKGKVIKLFGTVQDITQRKVAEEKIKASLKEKEVLLKEIHHRVKNNMQIIHSLLSLQSDRLKDRKVLSMIKETQQRIKSMAFVHERLYQSKDLARIEFGDYVKKLLMSLFHSYGIDSTPIKQNIDIDNVFLDINSAIPCGLIINELVSNSLKHAFPRDRVKGEKGHTEGEIYIGLSSGKNNKYSLIVSDNGIGFPEDLDFQNADSLGLQIVNTLVEQLEGSIGLQKGSGTIFKIEFTPE